MKSLFATKTFWSNAIMVVIALLTLPELGALVPQSALPFIALAIGALNVFLRTLTDTPTTSVIRTFRGTPVVLLAAALGFAPLIAACGAKAAPGNLSPAGVQAYHKTQVIKGLDLIRDTAIEANKQSPPLVSTDTTRKVVEFHQAALKTMQAYDSGWVAAVKALLDEVAAQVPERERSQLGPYFALAKALLDQLSA